MKRRLLILGIIVILGLVGWHTLFGGKTPAKIAKTTPTFNKTRLSITDPDSVWVVVNKLRPLHPATYQPSDLTVPEVALRKETSNEEMSLRSETATALETLMNAADKEARLELRLASGFRPYDLQKTIYQSEVEGFGQTYADTESARPGYSEHQTGLAADIDSVSGHCTLEDCFANTAEGKWLATNAYRFGFTIRYPKDKQTITGYKYEPWHIRYVGKELAGELHKTPNQTLEEFFSLPAATNYR